MKRKFSKLFVILVAFFCVIPLTHAETQKKEAINGFVVDASGGIDRSEDINGSAFLFANNVVMNYYVKGIGGFFGNNVTVGGDTDYLVTGGNDIKLNGEVANDGLVIGNVVTMNKDFHAKRDLMVFASNLTFEGDVDRDMVIYGSHIVIDNSVIARNLTIYADTIEIRGEAKIKGTLKYNEDAQITIGKQVDVHEKSVIPLSELHRATYVDQVWSNAMSYAALLFIFVVLVLVAPNLFKKLENQFEKLPVSQGFVMAGLGALALLLCPFIVFFLFMTGIGAALGILLIVAYIVAIYLTTLFVGYVLGYKIWQKWIKQKPNMLLIGLLGMGILFIASIIPYVGTIVSIITFFCGLGIIVNLFKRETNKEIEK